MLSKQQVLDAVKNGKESQCVDGRDYHDRLSSLYDLVANHNGDCNCYFCKELGAILKEIEKQTALTDSVKDEL